MVYCGRSVSIVSIFRGVRVATVDERNPVSFMGKIWLRCQPQTVMIDRLSDSDLQAAKPAVVVQRSWPMEAHPHGRK